MVDNDQISENFKTNLCNFAAIGKVLGLNVQHRKINLSKTDLSGSIRLQGIPTCPLKRGRESGGGINTSTSVSVERRLCEPSFLRLEIRLACR